MYGYDNFAINLLDKYINDVELKLCYSSKILIVLLV